MMITQKSSEFLVTSNCRNVFYQIVVITLIINCLQLTSHVTFSKPIAIDINTNNRSEAESLASAVNETANSTTSVQSIELSSTSTSMPSTTVSPITSTSTLPPPLPTPLPSKSYPKLYSGLPRSASIYLTMDNILQSKANDFGRTRRIKRSRSIKSDSSPGNPFSLIKLLLANHLTSSNDFPMAYSVVNKPTSGQFGSVYSSNLGDSLDEQLPLSSGNINNINSRFIQEPLASFYPTSNDLDLIELAGGDENFDAPNYGWSNQETADLINPMETNLGDNGVNLYSVDPFVPLRVMRRSQSEMLRPIVKKRKRRHP